MSKKRGQLEISFGMIFSIIIIIATIATAGYVIRYFVKVGNCEEVGFFYKDFNDEIEKAWNADRTQTTYEARIPSGVKKVCLGNLTLTADADDREEYEQLRRYSPRDRNVYLYPSKSACDSALPYYEAKHMRSDNFFCVTPENGKISIKIRKESSDALATVSE